jgi:hypothetical protein
MRRKTVGGSYTNFDEAYFGWIKFELDPGAIVGAKKAIEDIPEVFRILVITTVRENTYLGKRVPMREGKALTIVEDKKPLTSASIEEMDKSIEEMVKEV